MSDPTVRVATGSLRGIQLDGVRAFLGVPYAAPPMSDLSDFNRVTDAHSQFKSKCQSRRSGFACGT